MIANAEEYEAYIRPKLDRISAAFHADDRETYEKVIAEIRADGHDEYADNINMLYVVERFAPGAIEWRVTPSEATR